MPRPEPTPLARALGRVPSGVYIVSTLREGAPVAFVGSFVQQVAFEPPALVLAVARDREQLADLRKTGRFALSILGAGDQGLMSPFLKRLPEGTGPFDGLTVARTKSGLTVLEDALAWIDCRIAGEHDAGDHVVLFGVAEEAHLAREGDPRIHLRKNGLGY
ncbi:MAG: flavin reductase family protein [Planctomycetota bacterium]|nr:flavin reductase family protein [Planctomycetota bacterium]